MELVSGDNGGYEDRQRQKHSFSFCFQDDKKPDLSPFFILFRAIVQF